jgi:hypothetical protein
MRGRLKPPGDPTFDGVVGDPFAELTGLRASIVWCSPIDPGNFSTSAAVTVAKEGLYLSA